MRADLADEMRSSPPHYSLVVDGELWCVYVFGVSRLSDSWMVQLALFGSDVRTVVRRWFGANVAYPYEHVVDAVVRDAAAGGRG